MWLYIYYGIGVVVMIVMLNKHANSLAEAYSVIIKQKEKILLVPALFASMTMLLAWLWPIAAIALRQERVKRWINDNAVSWLVLKLPK